MIKLLKNAQVYSPAPLGKKDVLVIGDKVARIDDSIQGYDGLPEVEVIDLKGKKLLPGYIDIHIHITGGGGEQGFTSRVPESQLSVIVGSGITTVLGLLGTDGITRSMENLIAKAGSYNEEGITAYALTSAYGLPVHTLTGDVEKDVMMIDPIVGVKIAVSDHRSSSPTGEELIKVATAARRGGLLSAKPGLVMMHMGDGKGGLDPIFYVLDHADVPLKNLLPTHMTRKKELLEQGVELIRRGGYIDVTAGADPESLESTTDKLMDTLSKDGVTIDHISLSSDGYGSMPRFDDEGNCIGLTYASPTSLHATIKALVRRGVALEEAIKLLTTTPAELLGKTGVKGCVAVGADADLLVLDDELNIDALFARGRTAVQNGKVILKGRFEV